MPTRKQIKPFTLLLTYLLFLTGCAASKLQPVVNLTTCSEPRPEICTMNYRPVCEQLDDSSKIDSIGCNACSDPQVTGYLEGRMSVTLNICLFNLGSSFLLAVLFLISGCTFVRFPFSQRLIFYNVKLVTLVCSAVGLQFFPQIDRLNLKIPEIFLRPFSTVCWKWPKSSLVDSFVCCPQH